MLLNSECSLSLLRLRHNNSNTQQGNKYNNNNNKWQCDSNVNDAVGFMGNLYFSLCFPS